MVRAGDVAADAPLQASADVVGVSFHGMAV
jgi:hypothetical protein